MIFPPFDISQSVNNGLFPKCKKSPLIRKYYKDEEMKGQEGVEGGSSIVQTVQMVHPSE
jgi:hypothetical protein